MTRGSVAKIERWNVSNLPFPDHRHRLVAFQRSSGCPKATKAKSPAGWLFHSPVILLDDVVQVFHRPQP
jgi:hypothetical protein